MGEQKIRLNKLKIQKENLEKELAKEYNEQNFFTYDVLVQNGLWARYECGIVNDLTKKAKKIRELKMEIAKIEGENYPIYWRGPLVIMDQLVKSGEFENPDKIEKAAKFITYLEEKLSESEVDNQFKDRSSSSSISIQEELPIEEVIKSKIDSGESLVTEFKSTLRYNIRAKQHDKKITHSCLKTITAFLNSQGGVLLIGVKDSGKIIGIKKDGYKDYDQFENALYNFIRNSISQEAATLINAKVHQYEDEEVCVVFCYKSPKPVYLNYNSTEEEFFVRTGPSTTKLTPSQIHGYISKNFDL